MGPPQVHLPCNTPLLAGARTGAAAFIEIKAQSLNGLSVPASGPSLLFWAMLAQTMFSIIHRTPIKVTTNLRLGQESPRLTA